VRIPTTLIALAVFFATFASASRCQTAPPTPPLTSAVRGMPACDGLISIIRVSDITASGSMEKFMAAVAAQQAWYARRGYSDVIFATPLVVHDPETGAVSYSDKHVLTYHYIKPGNGGMEPDDDWNAFVEMFADTSMVRATYISCVPKSGAPAAMK